MAQTNGVATMRETERKYEAVDDWELIDPAGLLGFATGTGPHEQNLEAVYFDTADLRLLRTGITLRRREGGSDPGWHLKLPAGTDSRHELRLPLDRSPHGPPTAGPSPNLSMTT
ncbi:MAG TPA: CYTH domain-containing protein [Pseudonocardiaceae bacterium]